MTYTSIAMVSNMDAGLGRYRGKTAIVTGASAGIGAAIAETLVQSGVKVVGLARRMHKMEELVKKLAGMEGKFYPVRADVSKEEDIISAFDWTKKNVGPIHILINNAGVAKCGLLLEGTTDDWRKILNLNVLGLSVATREAVKDMRENNIDGHIVHINSILGHGVFFVGMNVYPPSKFAVTALTETLRQELNSIGSKIKITSISPGYVNTELPDLSGLNTTFPGKLPILEADDVAQAVIFSLATPPHVQIHEIIIKPVGEYY